MGDFIRYIITGAHDLTLGVVEGGLKAIDPEFALLPDPAAETIADLHYGSEVYGEVEVNRAEDQMFVEDIEDLLDQLAAVEGEDADKARAALDQATGMIALQLTEAGHEHYRRIDPLWDWLLQRYPGVLQVDEEGYYDQTGQILVMN